MTANKADSIHVKFASIKNNLPIYLTVLFILFSFVYYVTYLWMFERWTARDSYYSHGFLIPLMSFFLIWRKRHEIMKSEISFSAIGIFFFATGIFIQLISAFWRVHFTSAFSMIFILLGISLILFGKQANKYLIFPIIYLIFMIPLPLIAVADFSLRLKLFAAHSALKISELFGIIAVREGAVLHFRSGEMVIGDICSGLRSIIALLAFGAFYAYISNFSIPKKILIFLISMPIAIIANIIRIIVLCIIAEIWGVEKTGGMVHDISGISIFVVAFALLFSFERVLRLFDKKPAVEGKPEK